MAHIKRLNEMVNSTMGEPANTRTSDDEQLYTVVVPIYGTAVNYVWAKNAKDAKRKCLNADGLGEQGYYWTWDDNFQTSRVAVSTSEPYSDLDSISKLENDGNWEII